MLTRSSLLGYQSASDVPYVTGGAGASSGTTYTFTPSGLAAGDIMFVFTEQVSTGTIAISGGSGGTWTKDNVVQAGGERDWCLHRFLAAGDVGATFTCTVDFNITPVRYVVFRNVASRSLLQSVASAASASSLNFSAPTPGDGSSRLLAALAEHDAGAGSFTTPSGWTARHNLNAGGPKLVADVVTDQFAGGAISVATSVTSANGQIGFLYDLIGL